MIHNNVIKQTKANYNLIASAFSSKREYLSNDILYFKKYIIPKFSVLDLGCGNGRLVDILNPKTEYLGIDNSSKLLKIARQKYPKNQFKNQNILKLKLNKKFDIVFSLAVLHHLSEEYHLEFVRAVKQYLGKNGIIIISVWKLNKKQLESGEKQSKKEILIPFKDSGQKILAKRYIYQFDLKELENLFVENGFKILESGIQNRGKSQNLYLVATII